VHVDVSVFRIVNDARVFIQAIIDNASRYVLAWQVTQDYGGANTKALIEKALEVANRISGNVGIPNLFADDRRKCPWHEYLTDHNNRNPHYALGGAVPLEVFSATWTEESRTRLSE
jgi:transposase InsO family protein